MNSVVFPCVHYSFPTFSSLCSSISIFEVYVVDKINFVLFFQIVL